MEKQNAQQEKVKDAVLNATPEDIEKNKTMAMLSYILFFIPLLTDAKDSPFAKFHANQSLILLIAYVVLTFIPFLGWLLWMVVFVFWIMGIVSASKGEMKELPLIGGIHILDK